MILKKEFLTSGLLMEAVRRQDYKGQYKVCEAFFNMMMLRTRPCVPVELSFFGLQVRHTMGIECISTKTVLIIW